jgi:DNA-binding transcriptional LysR family regulator
VPAQYDNRISLQKLEVFCLVVELGGVSRAAEHLFVAQPVVTAHVQSLQKRLGVKLLHRDGRRMVLTDGGERVYKWARETLSRTRELMRELDGLTEGQRGSVAVAASMTVGSYTLPPVLARFREARPLAAITLAVSDPEGAMDAVESGESDFAVIMADAPPSSQALAGTVIGEEEILLVAAPDYQPSVTSLSVAELGDTPLVSSPGGHIRRGMIDQRLAERGARPSNVVIELGHPEAMKRATEDGLGMCLLFRSSVERELEDGRLREVRLQDGPMSVPLVAVLRSEKQLSPIQDKLLEAVKTAIERRPAPQPA